MKCKYAKVLGVDCRTLSDNSCCKVWRVLHAALHWLPWDEGGPGAAELTVMGSQAPFCSRCIEKFDATHRVNALLKSVFWHAHTHTRAQNCHCEFCCGMHLTCKNNPFNLTGVGHWKDLKTVKAAIAIASAKSSELEFNRTISLPNWQIAKTVQNCKK